jgi:hypothetical protein
MSVEENERVDGWKLTVSGEESNGGTLGSSTASSADTMNIILRVVGIVIVEHMSNVANIFKTGEDWLAIVRKWV